MVSGDNEHEESWYRKIKVSLSSRKWYTGFKNIQTYTGVDDYSHEMVKIALSFMYAINISYPQKNGLYSHNVVIISCPHWSSCGKFNNLKHFKILIKRLDDKLSLKENMVI